MSVRTMEDGDPRLLSSSKLTKASYRRRAVSLSTALRACGRSSVTMVIAPCFSLCTELSIRDYTQGGAGPLRDTSVRPSMGCGRAPL